MAGRPPPRDAALAIGLAILAVFEVVAGELDGSRAIMLAAAVLMTAPLAWRRRAPVATAVIACGVIAVEAFVVDAWPAPQAPFLVLLVAAWTSGVYAGLRGALAGAAAAIAAGCAWTSLQPNIDAGDYGFIAFILAAAWLSGRFLRERQLYAEAIEARAASLEREREANARAAIAEERARIARELHDVVAHNVSVMVVQAGVERQLLDGAHASTGAVLRSIEVTGKAALAEMRRVLGALRRSDDALELAPPNGVAGLGLLAERMAGAGLAVDVRVEGDAVALPASVDLSAYRIVQEALTNTLRHASASHADVVLRYGSSDVELEVVDDGGGAAPDGAGGHGLAGMRERAVLLGGDLHAGSLDGGGFAVRARLPLAPT